MHKYGWLFAALPVMLFLACGGTFTTTSTDGDKDKLQGTWAVESMVVDGKEVAAELIKGMKYVFSADRVTVTVGTIDDHGTYTINSGNTPKTLDIVSVNAKNKPSRCIYTFEGEKLKIALGDGGNRPTDFSTSKGTTNAVLICKREK
jgi:uncharacterized protein (TIGR03067 family)